MLQPQEWKGIHFGLAFDSLEEIRVMPQLLQDLELRDGFSYTQHADESLLTTGSEYALMVKNNGTSVVTLPAHATACKLIL